VLRIAVVLVVLGGMARAETVPTFAVDLRSKDALADKITSSLEDAMRTVKRADYRAKGTRKDRVAASTDDCPTGLPTKCAVAIGARLGVDYMFIGTVETRGNRFVLSLDIVHVRSGNRVRSLRDLVPATTDATTWAKSVLRRIGDTATGALTISCNAARAVVLVDGLPATDLYQGRGTVTGLALGTHAIEVRAAGYKSYVGEVTIVGDTPLNVLLDAVTR
jgi:hypothetical protein